LPVGVLCLLIELTLAAMDFLQNNMPLAINFLEVFGYNQGSLSEGEDGPVPLTSLYY